MKYLIKIILNKIYLFDLRIHESPFGLLFPVVWILLSMIFLYFINLFIGIIGLCSICAYILLIPRISLDLSIYDIPVPGDKIVFTKDYDESEFFNKILTHIPGQYRHVMNLNKISIKGGTEFSICSQHPNIKGLVLRIIDNDSKYYDVFYLDIKGYFKTKSQLRDDKLKKILS